MESKHLDNATLAAGISPNYINAHSKPQSISTKTKQHLLDTMHQHTTTKVAVTPVPNVMVYTSSKKMPMVVEGSSKYSWLLTTKEGTQYKGHVTGGKAFNLPTKLPEGYHTLTLTQEDQRTHCRVIVTPKHCYKPQALLNKQKLWGACVQLYTLQSEKNWGIGDFGNLKAMLVDVAKHGRSFISLNPIHALYPANPESASPYSPSSRHWLNVIYININTIKDFHLSKEAQAWWQLPTTQQTLQQAQDANWVNYSTVTTLKMTALQMAWKGFTQHDDEQMATFHQFVADHGNSLFWQAAFDALHAQQVKEDKMHWGWPAWPEMYQNMDSPEVHQFCKEHHNDIDFYLWLQWLAYSQFATCWEISQGYEMPIGLYHDLAVGIAEGGAETWCDHELYCLKASVGTPPDILSPLGQNWGLPPMDPHIITTHAYEPFIKLLHANMQNYSTLQIDHVMSMLHLWWIPYGKTADQGTYVHYPVDDLLSILALKSKHHHCMVIGEDLSTIPVEIVSKLRSSSVYSYKVLYFKNNHKKTFHSPKAYPEQSMAVAATHDLPTLHSYWESRDLTLGKTLGLYPDEVVLHSLYQDHELAKQGLLDALHKYGCLPKHARHKASLMSMTPTLNHGLQHYIANSNSALLGLQPEDWLDMAKPVNIPGTSYQYKNWQRKLSTTLETMFANDGMNKLLKDLDRQHRAAAKKK